MSEYQQYPMLMVHPNFRKAKSVKVNPELSDAKSDWRQVGNDQFPPVTVHNLDQEELHRAQGYIPNGHGDPAAYAEAHADAPEPNYEAEQYPKWVHGRLCNNEDDELKAMEAYEEELTRPVPVDNEQTEAPQTDIQALIASAVAQAVAQAVPQIIQAVKASAAPQDDPDDYLEPEQRRGPGRPRKVA